MVTIVLCATPLCYASHRISINNRTPLLTEYRPQNQHCQRERGCWSRMCSRIVNRCSRFPKVLGRISSSVTMLSGIGYGMGTLVRRGMETVVECYDDVYMRCFSDDDWSHRKQAMPDIPVPDSLATQLEGLKYILCASASLCVLLHTVPYMCRSTLFRRCIPEYYEVEPIIENDDENDKIICGEEEVASVTELIRKVDRERNFTYLRGCCWKRGDYTLLGYILDLPVTAGVAAGGLVHYDRGGCDNYPCSAVNILRRHGFWCLFLTLSALRLGAVTFDAIVDDASSARKHKFILNKGRVIGDYTRFSQALVDIVTGYIDEPSYIEIDVSNPTAAMDKLQEAYYRSYESQGLYAHPRRSCYNASLFKREMLGIGIIGSVLMGTSVGMAALARSDMESLNQYRQTHGYDNYSLDIPAALYIQEQVMRILLGGSITALSIGGALSCVGVGNDHDCDAADIVQDHKEAWRSDQLIEETVDRAVKYLNPGPPFMAIGLIVGCVGGLIFFGERTLGAYHGYDPYIWVASTTDNTQQTVVVPEYRSWQVTAVGQWTFMAGFLLWRLIQAAHGRVGNFRILSCGLM